MQQSSLRERMQQSSLLRFYRFSEDFTTEKSEVVDEKEEGRDGEVSSKITGGLKIIEVVKIDMPVEAAGSGSNEASTSGTKK